MYWKEFFWVSDRQLTETNSGKYRCAILKLVYYAVRYLTPTRGSNNDSQNTLCVARKKKFQQTFCLETTKSSNSNRKLKHSDWILYINKGNHYIIMKYIALFRTINNEDVSNYRNNLIIMLFLYPHFFFHFGCLKKKRVVILKWHVTGRFNLYRT